jgi:ubiquinone biosynthesis protein
MKSFFSIIYIIWVLIWDMVFYSLFVSLYYRKRNIHKYHHHLQKLGKNLCIALPKLGPAFVKLGQFLSTRYDLINHIVCKELKRLQDSAPQVEFKKIEKTLILELGDKFQDLKVDIIPIAAASVAQVHKGYTACGCVVAVKVLRPNVRKSFMGNINLMMLIAGYFNRFVNPAKRLRLLEVVNLIAETANSELNMQMEAAASDKLRYNCRDQDDVYIPKVFWEYTTHSVFVSEWIDGSKLEECDIDIRKNLATKLAFLFFKQAYIDGFFHADIHPGNIMVDKLNRLVLVDFGMFSYLPERDRLFLAEIIYGFITKDYDKISELHFKAGYVPADNETLEKLQNRFSLACRTIAEPIFGKPKMQISISKLLRRLFEITSEFNMQTQPQLVLLQKNMMSLESVLAMLDPEVNMWLLVEPWFTEWATNNLDYISKAKRKYYRAAKILAKLEDIVESIKI